MRTPRTDAILEEIDDIIDREGLSFGYATMVDHAKDVEDDLEKFISDIRKLVGEWREKASTLSGIQARNKGTILEPAAFGSSGAFDIAADALSAVIEKHEEGRR